MISLFLMKSTIPVILIYQRGSGFPRDVDQSTLEKGSQGSAFADDDRQLLEVITQRQPSLRSRYEADLRNVNMYIHDAKMSIQRDPNDEEAQASLMEAYEQRSMVYEMALDPYLP